MCFFHFVFSYLFCRKADLDMLSLCSVASLQLLVMGLKLFQYYCENNKKVRKYLFHMQLVNFISLFVFFFDCSVQISFEKKLLLEI